MISRKWYQAPKLETEIHMINIIYMLIAHAHTNRKDDIFMQRRHYIDEAHMVLDIFSFLKSFLKSSCRDWFCTFPSRSNASILHPFFHLWLCHKDICFSMSHRYTGYRFSTISLPVYFTLFNRQIQRKWLYSKKISFNSSQGTPCLYTRNLYCMGAYCFYWYQGGKSKNRVSDSLPHPLKRASTIIHRLCD